MDGARSDRKTQQTETHIPPLSVTFTLISFHHATLCIVALQAQNVDMSSSPPPVSSLLSSPHSDIKRRPFLPVTPLPHYHLPTLNSRSPSLSLDLTSPAFSLTIHTIPNGSQLSARDPGARPGHRQLFCRPRMPFRMGHAHSCRRVCQQGQDRNGYHGGKHSTQHSFPYLSLTSQFLTHKSNIPPNSINR